MFREVLTSGCKHVDAVTLSGRAIQQHSKDICLSLAKSCILVGLRSSRCGSIGDRRNSLWSFSVHTHRAGVASLTVQRQCMTLLSILLWSQKLIGTKLCIGLDHLDEHLLVCDSLREDLEQVADLDPLSRYGSLYILSSDRCHRFGTGGSGLIMSAQSSSFITTTLP